MSIACLLYPKIHNISTYFNVNVLFKHQYIKINFLVDGSKHECTQFSTIIIIIFQAKIGTYQYILFFDNKYYVFWTRPDSWFS